MQNNSRGSNYKEKYLGTVSMPDYASQYLPFDALKGLDEALRQKEIVYDDRIYLSDEAKEDISDVINSLNTGDIISVRFFKNRKYQNIEAYFVGINLINKKIKLIMNGNKEITEICIQDIVNIAKKY